uniref:Uncharacterized protein n=1 Tax=Anguilla anguilla TaxID=7936 RepID=A0A0E9Q5T4_ANGAN
MCGLHDTREAPLSSVHTKIPKMPFSTISASESVFETLRFLRSYCGPEAKIVAFSKKYPSTCKSSLNPNCSRGPLSSCL